MSSSASSSGAKLNNVASQVQVKHLNRIFIGNLSKSSTEQGITDMLAQLNYEVLSTSVQYNEAG